MEQVSIKKQVYNSKQYKQVIDTLFTQLVTPVQNNEIIAEITVEEFFKEYTDLFYQIPKQGVTNSHEYLIQQSSDYVGEVLLNQDILALQQEITSLREENLQLQEQLLNLARLNG